MIEIYRAPDGWRWRIKGKNGQVMASGEAYASRSNAVRGVTDLIDLITNQDLDLRFLADVKPDTDALQDIP